MPKKYLRPLIVIAPAAAAALAVYLVVPACNVNESITAPGESQPPFWLWNADSGENCIFKINPVSGDVVASFDMPFIERDCVSTGLTWGGEYFWHTYYKPNGSKAKLCKMQIEGRAFSVIRSWDLTLAEPSGLAWRKGGTNEDYLWSGDAATGKIYEIHVQDRSIEVTPFGPPCDEPSGLAWDKTYLWVADKKSDSLYKIDPSEIGSVPPSCESPGRDPTGLAWDGTYLWNADEYTGLIYKIEPNEKVTIVDHFKSPRYSPQGLAVQIGFKPSE
jgi:hypothetical protein